MILNIIVFLCWHCVLHFLELVQFCCKCRYSVKGKSRGKKSLLLSNNVICRLTCMQGLTEKSSDLVFTIHAYPCLLITPQMQVFRLSQ